MQNFTLMNGQAALEVSTWSGYEMKPGHEMKPRQEIRLGAGCPVEGKAAYLALEIVYTRTEEQDFIDAMIRYVDRLLGVNPQEERSDESPDGGSAASSNRSSPFRQPRGEVL